MTPAARVQTAIEIVGLVVDAANAGGPPANRIVAEWFRTRRFAGSGDRRAVRELVYRAIRACGEVPASGRAAMLLLAQGDSDLSALFDGSRHGPEPMAEDEPAAGAGLAPGWLGAALAASGIAGEEAQALLDRAPLDIRINTLKASRDALELPVSGVLLATPDGVRLPPATPVESWDAYREGKIEVQDAGSQIAAWAVRAAPGETIVDLCAGAGGKTLALAADMANRGRIIACDTDRGRLSRLSPRAQRAGAAIVEPVLLDPGKEVEGIAPWRGKADAVLVDAPCSGTGTWRRNPEARWRLGETLLAQHVALQARLLDLAATLVAPGGRLVYAVCSLLDAEGADQVAGFLARNGPKNGGKNGVWRADALALPAGRPQGQGVRLTPYHDGTDGFFIARLSPIC